MVFIAGRFGLNPENVEDGDTSRLSGHHGGRPDHHRYDVFSCPLGASQIDQSS
jgi:hypothetical protein